MTPLCINNDQMLEGMKVVGERFGAGEVQRPFVLQQWGLKPGRGEDGASYEELVEREGRPRLRSDVLEQCIRDGFPGHRLVGRVRGDVSAGDPHLASASRSLSGRAPWEP